MVLYEIYRANRKTYRFHSRIYWSHSKYTGFINIFTVLYQGNREFKPNALWVPIEAIEVVI